MTAIDVSCDPLPVSEWTITELGSLLSSLNTLLTDTQKGELTTYKQFNPTPLNLAPPGEAKETCGPKQFRKTTRVMRRPPSSRSTTAVVIMELVGLANRVQHEWKRRQRLGLGAITLKLCIF
eukprot:4481758-Amphidinium_carterae.1